MFAKFLIAPLFIATSVVAHPAFTRRGDVSLSDWPSQNLESYWKFKMRFNSLGCASQTGTDFYTSCCYPLGASESLSGRPAECTPTTCAAPSSSSNAVSDQSTPTYEVASVPTTSVYEDDNDDDLPYCDDDDSEYDDGENWSDSSSSQYDNPTPTPTYDQPTISQDNAQPTTTAQDSGNNNSANVNYGGFATYYYQNGNPGACGDYKGDYDLIAAIDSSRYGDLGQKSGLCGQKVHIKNTNNGNTVEVTICDACPTCTNGNSIDLSVGAFQALASLDDGLIPIEWSFA